jgi:N-methylhydantoinase A/oxoprolinase/acetone carboxylase beta subunit
MSVRVGVDTGGTFTDFVILDPSGMRVWKVLSTPDDPGRAILQGLTETGVLGREADIIHGSTVATNALLERKGAKLALLTTEGFEDILHIGRQTRRELYNILVEKRQPLIPRRLCFGLPERTLADGVILKAINPAQVWRVARRLKREGVESVALCLLHSYANAGPEETVLRVLRRNGLACSASHRILPEYREFERASTTAINAYVGPLMTSYLGRLEKDLKTGRLRVMQSNGGCVSSRGAKETPVCTILSGPAGGVVGAKEVAERAGYGRIISFDMGGTSTDVSLCDREIATTTESIISDLPLKMPIIDIHSVGSGGGSIAFIDEGGALRVGPRSAGADPGPVCYGRGDEVTVTDANLVLGRLDPGSFLGGAMKLYPERARRAVERFASRLGLTASRLAEGIIRVADATMERAIRVISVERGHDPRDFALLSFGGAGGMHACSLAQRLCIPTVIVPKNAGVLSALGMLLSDVVKDYSHSVLKTGDEVRFAALEPLFGPVLNRALPDLRSEGFGRGRVRLLRSLDVRYIGQSYEITVPFTRDYRRVFDAAHLRLYGYSDERRSVEVVNLRVKAVGLTRKPVLVRRPGRGADPSAARVARRPMTFDGRVFPSDIYRRDRLQPGNVLRGPALVCDYESTSVVSPGFSCRVDGFGNLIIHQGRER